MKTYVSAAAAQNGTVRKVGFDPKRWCREEASVPQDVLDQVHRKWHALRPKGTDYWEAYCLYFQKAPGGGVHVSVVGEYGGDGKNPMQTARVQEHWYLSAKQRIRYHCPYSKKDMGYLETFRVMYNTIPIHKELFVQTAADVEGVFAGTFLEGSGLIDYWKSPKTEDWLGSACGSSPLLVPRVSYQQSIGEIENLLHNAEKYRFLESVCALAPTKVKKALEYQSSHSSPVDMPLQLSQELDKMLESGRATPQQVCQLADLLYPEGGPELPRGCELEWEVLEDVLDFYSIHVHELIQYLQKQAELCGVSFRETFAWVKDAFLLAKEIRSHAGEVCIPENIREASAVYSQMLQVRRKHTRCLSDAACDEHTVSQVGSSGEWMACAWKTGCMDIMLSANKMYRKCKNGWIVVRDPEGIPCGMAFLDTRNNKAYGIYLPCCSTEKARAALQAYADQNGLPVHESVEDYIDFVIKRDSLGLHVHEIQDSLESASVQYGCHDEYLALDRHDIEKRICRELMKGRSRKEIAGDFSMLNT